MSFNPNKPLATLGVVGLLMAGWLGTEVASSRSEYFKMKNCSAHKLGKEACQGVNVNPQAIENKGAAETTQVVLGSLLATWGGILLGLSLTGVGREIVEEPAVESQAQPGVEVALIHDLSLKPVDNIAFTKSNPA